MLIELRRAEEQDARKLWEMQVRSFETLLRRYNDASTNPACETEEAILAKIRRQFSCFYLILADGEPVGGVRVVKREGGRWRIAPLFVVPEYQRKGIAQAAMRQLDAMYPGIQWELNTILEEEGCCHLYEKMGFVRTGEYEKINERKTLVYYRKQKRG